MYNLSVTCTCTIDFDQFELQRSLIRINFLLPDLQNFKSLESVDIHQNFCLQSLWHLVFRMFKSSDAWRRSSELVSSESSTWFLGKASEYPECDILQSQKHNFRSALECYLYAINF